MEDDLELSAVWGSSLPVSSQVLRFQAILFEEMGDDLEDTLMWRFRLRVLLSQKSQKLQEVHVVQKVQEIVRVISDEEVDNDRFLCGLLQQEKRRGSNMDHFNREREVLSFCTNVTGGK